MYYPSPPKLTCIPPLANSDSAYVRTLLNVHVPKINVSLTDVCILPSIKLASVKNTCRYSHQKNAITSCPQSLRGDGSARLLIQSSTITHPSLKEKAGEIVGVGDKIVTQSMNQFTHPSLKEKAGEIVGLRSQFVTQSINQFIPCRSVQNSRQGANPCQNFPQSTRGRQDATIHREDRGMVSRLGFPTVYSPANSRPSAPLCTEKKSIAPMMMTHASDRLVRPAGTHTSIKHNAHLPSRAWASATRVIRKYKRNTAPARVARASTRVRTARTTRTVRASTRTARALTRTAEAAPSRSFNPLGRHLLNWKTYCKPNAWILRILSHGYRLQFARRPPLTRDVIYTPARGQALAILKMEVQTLLDKKAVQKVDLEKNPAGFYSKYFLVPKKNTDSMRPILDLRGLNRYLKRLPFKMLTTAALLRRMRRGAWFCSVDLQDAFFHVSIYPPHRKFLRFGLDGEVYQFTVLPFGMSLSPRVFAKCTEAAIAPLRSLGIQLFTYLDDWLISADTREEARRHTEMVVSHLSSLGFMLNLEKSSLVPSQQTTFLGIMLDSTTLGARLSQDRIDTFLACARTLRLGDRVPYKTCMRVVGFMASAIHLIRLGRFFMRPFQKWVLSLRIPPSQGSRLVRVSQACTRALEPWLRTAFLSRGVRMGLVLSVKFITTDASLSGWGAIHNGMTAKGVWSSALKTKHINYLELMAVFLALKRFELFVRDSHVHVRTDNTAALCYINKQGGLASPALDRLARELTLWCDTRLRSIRASHLAGLQNTGADLLSRGRYYYGDWSLHPGVARQIFARYGCPDVDLFASEKNAKCSRFFSIQGAAPLGLEAFAHDWPRERLYAFPPLQLILPTLERVRLQGLSVLLVAPGWGTWRSEIAPLLYADPWRLPPLRDLVSQADGEILHPRPAELDLWVWPVSGNAWLPAD